MDLVTPHLKQFCDNNISQECCVSTLTHYQTVRAHQLERTIHLKQRVCESWASTLLCLCVCVCMCTGVSMCVCVLGGGGGGGGRISGN